MAQMYCVTCGNVGSPKSSRSIIILLLLLMCGLIPGIIYLLISGKKVCRVCGSNQVVPINSPIATKALTQQRLDNQN